MNSPSFKLRILGPTTFQAPSAEGADALLRQSKRLALLAYLAVATTDGYRRRDQVIALFWPEVDQATARSYLRKALHGLRECLGDDLVLSRGEDEICVDRTRLWCDAVAMPEAVDEGRWSEALSLYRGDLLEGLFPEGMSQEFHEWLATQRRRLREYAARAAWECSTAEEARGDQTAATVMARRARELDPDNEAGVRRLMELLDRRGDRAGALRVYHEWQSRMAEEFGVEPAPETRKVARRIQASRKGESRETPPRGDQPRDAYQSEVSQQGPPARRWPYPPLLLLALAALAGVGLAFTAWKAQDRSSTRASVVVTSLKGLGGGSAADIAASLTEELTTRLAMDSTVLVFVAASNSADGPVAALSRPSAAAPATYVLEGAVQQGPTTTHVTLRVLRASDGLTAWAATYDRPGGSSVLETSTAIAALAVQELRARLGELSRR